MIKNTHSLVGTTVEKTYTIPEIAAILKISVRKAYMLCKETKEFKVIHIGRCVRVKKDSFDQWFSQSAD